MLSSCFVSDVLMVTMVTRVLVPGTLVGRACAPVERAVATSMQTPVDLTRAPIASSVTAALVTQVTSTAYTGS